MNFLYFCSAHVQSVILIIFSGYLFAVPHNKQFYIRFRIKHSAVELIAFKQIFGLSYFRFLLGNLTSYSRADEETGI